MSTSDATPDEILEQAVLAGGTQIKVVDKSSSCQVQRLATRSSPDFKS